MTSTHHKSKEKRAAQASQERRAAFVRRCPDCLEVGAMTRITNGTRCRSCGATYIGADAPGQRAARPGVLRRIGRAFGVAA